MENRGHGTGVWLVEEECEAYSGEYMGEEDHRDHQLCQASWRGWFGGDTR